MKSKHIEGLKARGILKIKVHDANGALIEDTQNNLIVNLGYETICKQISAPVLNLNVSKIAFGEGTAPVTPADTGVTNPYIKAVDAVTYPQSNQVEFSWSLGIGENNGVNISEFALFSEDGTTIFSKVVRSPIAKTSLISLSGTWTIIF